MSPADTALRHSIEHLYDVFSIYPLPEIVEGCPCCTTEADNLRIHSKPLRQLEGDDLDRFAMKALSTWGDLSDFKHFLPRLLELLALDWYAFTMPEALLGTLMYNGTLGHPSPTWLEWPDRERLALEGYFRAVWTWSLVNPGYPRAEDRLSALAQACRDLTPLLDIWWSLEQDEGALAQLAYFMFYHDAELQRGVLAGTYWSQNPEGMAQVLRWAQNPRTTEMLKQGLPLIRHMDWLEQNGISQDWIDWILAT